MVLNQWEDHPDQRLLPPDECEALRAARAGLGLQEIALQSIQLNASKAGAFKAQQDIEELRQRVEDIISDISAILADNDISMLNEADPRSELAESDGVSDAAIPS